MTPILALALIAAAPNGVPRSECFPVETLPAAQRARAEALLLKALDGEALFTLVGGLKPISSGWVSQQVNVDKPALEAVELDRQAVRAIRSGDEVFATLQPFWRVYEGKRYLDGFLYHRAGVARAVRDHQWFFAFYGITPSSHPVEVAMAFEVDETAQRNRGYGYLFGYPDHAVNFFVESEESSRKTKKFVPRDFVNVPVFSGEQGRFVYAVPKGHVANDADAKLKSETAPILAYYRKLRPKYIGPGKPGPARLLRDWFDDGKGSCSSETALAKAKAG